LRRDNRRSLRRVRILVAVSPPALYQVIEYLFRGRPDFEVVGSLGGFRNLKQQSQRLVPELIVANVRPFKTDVCRAVASIKRFSPTSKLILICSVEDLAYQAKRCGADAYLYEEGLIGRLLKITGALASHSASTSSQH
jgi:DNA-binding NarL/FixJ family response regulator